MRAELILGLCDRFHKLPSEVLAEDAELLQLIEIAKMGRRPEPEEPMDLDDGGEW